MMRRIFVLWLCFFLVGCSDDTVAPVVNAWYQKNAASNYYIVQDRDTIYSIAFAFGLDYRALAKANDLMPPYPLTPGQRLVMVYQGPASTGSVSTPTEARPGAAVIVATPGNSAPIIQPLSGSWLWPVKGPLIGYYSTSAAGRPGISIAGHVGRPIRAAESGQIVYSGDGVRGYGNLIIIKHNETYLSAYAFNEQNLVTTGDRVRAGQVIARMGQNDAGRSLLYFEIRRNGSPVNPLDYLH